MNTTEIIDHYQKNLKPTYESLGIVIEKILKVLLTNMKYHSITSRCKDIISLKGKIENPEKNYNDPLTEITDLVGVRIIAYFPSDIDLILPILERAVSYT